MASRTGHVFMMERFARGGKPFYQIYNSWKNVYTFKQALLDAPPEDPWPLVGGRPRTVSNAAAIASQPMNEAQMVKFVTQIQAAGADPKIWHALFVAPGDGFGMDAAAVCPVACA